MSQSDDELLDLSKIKKFDPWVLIDTYFRDNPNYKTQHQIDSFNEFIFSETNGIRFIIKRENPLIIYKDTLDSEKGTYKHEIHRPGNKIADLLNRRFAPFE